MKLSYDTLFQNNFILTRESQLLGEACKLLHINQTRTNLYYSQCNGLVEEHYLACWPLVKVITHLIEKTYS